MLLVFVKVRFSFDDTGVKFHMPPSCSVLIQVRRTYPMLMYICFIIKKAEFIDANVTLASINLKKEASCTGNLTIMGVL